MITIFKYPISVQENLIDLPVGAEILTIQLQNGEPHIWVKLDDEELDTEEHSFTVVGTGWKLGEIGNYLGTWQQNGLVWHVFHQKNISYGH